MILVQFFYKIYGYLGLNFGQEIKQFMFKNNL